MNGDRYQIARRGARRGPRGAASAAAMYAANSVTQVCLMREEKTSELTQFVIERFATLLQKPTRNTIFLIRSDERRQLSRYSSQGFRRGAGGAGGRGDVE